MNKAMLFDDLVMKCPYTCVSSANNGYGCLHPQQEEKAVHGQFTEGLCYCFSCPLGHAAEQEDYDDEEYKKDIDWSEFFDEGEDADIGEDEFIIVRENLLKIDLSKVTTKSCFRIDYDKEEDKFLLAIVYKEKDVEVISKFDDYESTLKKCEEYQSALPLEMEVIAAALIARIDLMDDDDKEALVQGVEAAKDYGCANDLHESEHKTYEAIIKERRESDEEKL